MERSETEEQVTPVRTLWMRDDDLRIGWKLTAFTAVMLLSSFVMFAGLMVLGNIIPLMLAYSQMQMAAAFAATAFCMVLIERRSVLDIGLWFRPPALAAVGIGIALATGMQLLLLGAELLPGLARITLLRFEFTHAISVFAFGAIQFSIVAVGEEVLSRGYPFLALQRRYNSVTALLVTSAVFSLMHAGNPSVTIFALVNIFLAGIWLGVARILSGALWLPIGLHLAWNLVLGTVLGYPVSGIVEASIFKTDVVGPNWLTGGLFGPEGGVIVTIVLAAGSIALFHPALRRRYEDRGVKAIKVENQEEEK